MDNTEVTLTALFLAEGFNQPLQTGEEHPWEPMGGHIEHMAFLVIYAVEFEWYLKKLMKDTPNLPGVLHYEFTPLLGKWLFGHPDASFPAFRQEMTSQWVEWAKPPVQADAEAFVKLRNVQP